MRSSCRKFAVDSSDNKIFNNLKSGEEWLSTKEAAAYLKVSPRTVLNMCSNGTLTYYKLGRRNRYLQDDLRVLLIRKGGHNAETNQNEARDRYLVRRR